LAKSFIKKVEPIETNIVIFEIDESFMTSDTFVNKLKEKDILIIGMGQGKLRMVTHLDYTDEMHDVLLKQLAAF
jgi:threonine aldolase